jgi:hypothetical protein
VIYGGQMAIRDLVHQRLAPFIDPLAISAREYAPLANILPENTRLTILQISGVAATGHCTKGTAKASVVTDALTNKSAAA